MARRSRVTELELAVGVERYAPRELLAQLRVIDPTAELIYMGHGRWALGRIVRVARLRGAGERLAASCERALLKRWRRIPLGMDHHRYRTAQLRLRDFQFTSEYVMLGEPDARIVRDQEVMQYLYTHLSEQETSDLADKDMVERQRIAHAQLRDEYRHLHAHAFISKLTHSVTRHEKLETPVRSGFSRIITSAPLSS